MTRRATRRGVATLAAAIALAAASTVATPPAARACRCAPRTLAEYYEAADEVLMARLLETEERGVDRVLHLQVMGTAWRAAPFRDAPPRPGDRVSYVTAGSTAACGVPATAEAIYVLFATAPGDADGGGGKTGDDVHTLPRIDTCSGSRIHLAPGTEPAGFDDVPARFVAGQLNALGGMDVLRAVAARAPREDDPEGTRLIGLLDLKGLAHGGVAPVRAARDLATKPIAVIGSYDDVESREYAYEQPGAIVLTRVDGWCRVRLTNGATGWIAPEDAGTWFPYAELPLRRLAYLTGHWSGYVWPDAGAGLPARSPRRERPGREEYAAEVHESMLVGGMPWFRIDVLNGNPCEDGDIQAELSGWVPGYGADGEPTVWFWSRGC